MWRRQSDLDRRIATLEQRVTWLDEHGTRGVTAVQTQITGLASTVGEIKQQLASLDREVGRVGGRVWPQVLTIIGLMVPLYAMVITVMVR